MIFINLGVIESSYSLITFTVCSRILEAAASVVCTFDIPVETVLLFISALPREFTDCGGQLRLTVQQWLSGCGYKDCCANCCINEMKLCKNLYDFPQSFISNHLSIDISRNFDDGDFSAWEFEANRWARVLFLAITEEHPLEPILMFIQKIGSNIFKQNHDSTYIGVKLLILASSLVLELRRTRERVIEWGNKARTNIGSVFLGVVDEWSFIDDISKKLVDTFMYLLDDLVQFANHSCSIFWSGDVEEDTALPGAVKGKLGGPSQRRLPISATTAVLQAVGTFCTFIIVGCLNSIQSWRFKKIIHCGCHHCSVEFLSKLVKCRYTVIQTTG